LIIILQRLLAPISREKEGHAYKQAPLQQSRFKKEIVNWKQRKKLGGGGGGGGNLLKNRV